MGLIALALVTGTKAKVLDTLPRRAHFLRLPEFEDIPTWVIYRCALTLPVTARAGYGALHTLRMAGI